MAYYFEISENTKKYQEKARTTPAVFIHKDLRNQMKNGATISVKQFTK